LFTGSWPTVPENFTQIRSEVLRKVANRQTDKQTNDDYISLAEVIIMMTMMMMWMMTVVVVTTTLSFVCRHNMVTATTRASYKSPVINQQ